MDEIVELLLGLFFFSLLIGGFYLLMGGEREGSITYSDCRQIIDLPSDNFQKYYKKFTCSYVKDSTGKITDEFCVHTDTVSSAAGSYCNTAYTYERSSD